MKEKQSLVSIHDFTKEDILRIMELAADFEANPDQRLLYGKVVASLFSSRRPARGSASRARSIAWGRG